MKWVVFSMLVSVGLAFADDPEPQSASKPRELEIKGIRIDSRPARDLKPTKITSTAELEKAITDKEVREKIAKQVDFKKEYLLLFAWAGSGRDKLSFEVKDSEVVFTRTMGLTRDLRSHVKLFAIPEKLSHKMQK